MPDVVEGAIITVRVFASFYSDQRFSAIVYLYLYRYWIYSTRVSCT